MPEQAQSKYMNLNEFLETFFAAMDADEGRIGYFPNMVKNNESIQSLHQIIKSFAQDLGPNTRKLFEQYWNARNDNSVEAYDFLNMVKTITIWYAENYGRGDLQMPAKTVMRLCNSGKIKNPEFALRLLKTMQDGLRGENLRRVNPQMCDDVSYMIATNPAAQPFDVYKFANTVHNDKQSKYYADAPAELTKMLNDQMVHVDAKIGAELAKDFPNVENIQKSGAGTLPNIAEIIYEIMQKQQMSGTYTPQDIQQAKEIVRTLEQKYSMDNILNLELGNYVQQFEDQSSLKLAKMEPEYKKMEQELSVAQKSQREMRSAYDEKINEIRALTDKIDKLESELRKEKTKNTALSATVNTYIEMAEARVGGSVLNIRKDMSDELGRLKRNIENGRASM